MDKYNIPYVKTFEYTKIIGIDNIQFGKYIIIDDFVLIYAKNKIKFGNYIHISSYSSITGPGELIMEDFSGLSSGVRIVTGSDDFKGQGFGNPAIAEKFRNVKSGNISIGRFAIIGANSVILPDVHMGEGVAVAAGSVVSKDLEAWGIYAGNRRIGERDKKGILENYSSFLACAEKERLGSLFRTK